MAVNVHVANVSLVTVNAAGVVKPRVGMTIGEAIRTNNEVRIMQDATLPHTTGYPTVKTYLELEAADGFLLYHLDQTYCITYDA